MADEIGRRPRGMPADVLRDLMNGVQCRNDVETIKRLLRREGLRIFRV
jgi:hypothetical protein